MQTDLHKYLIEKRDKLRSELSQVEKALKAITEEDSPAIAQVDAFRWKQKIIELFSLSPPTFRKTREIALYYFPDAKGKELKKRIINASGALNGLKEKGRIKSFESDGHGSYFGLAEWFDGDIPKEEIKNKSTSYFFNMPQL